MKNYFFDIMSDAFRAVSKDDVLCCSFSGEDTFFARLNNNKIRQVGDVKQYSLLLQLIRGTRSTSASVRLSGEKTIDVDRLKSLLNRLNAQVAQLPEDPHLNFSKTIASGDAVRSNELPAAHATVERIISTAKGLDLVGLYCSGGIYRGFANSLGQRNWFESYSFDFNFSVYHQKDKAVKSHYAGFNWSDDDFAKTLSRTRTELELIRREPKTIAPGKYRVYLAPSAVAEIAGMLQWSGFGLKAHKTKTTALLKMIEEGRRLHPQVTMMENTVGGIAPNFDTVGFIKPDRVVLVEDGAYKGCLSNARSAKEFGMPCTGSHQQEIAESFEMKAGDIPQDQVLQKLDRGLYINNLHYLNYSDMPACRMTGLTRFATLWVENGETVAPVNVMRFDDSVYRIFGEKLIGLTREREYIFESHTYDQRMAMSINVPGALVEEFALTL